MPCGQCPVCGQTVPTWGGYIVPHYHPTILTTSRNACAGSGRPPRG